MQRSSSLICRSKAFLLTDFNIWVTWKREGKALMVINPLWVSPGTFHQNIYWHGRPHKCFHFSFQAIKLFQIFNTTDYSVLVIIPNPCKLREDICRFKIFIKTDIDFEKGIRRSQRRKYVLSKLFFKS